MILVLQRSNIKKGKQTRRPDLVLYINGIALGVLELKEEQLIYLSIVKHIQSKGEVQRKNFFYHNTVYIFSW
jgi:type I restriction enzyme R subunit